MSQNINSSFWQNITTQRNFDSLKFIEILTSTDFPEKDARRWIDDRYPLTVQLSFLYVFVVFGTRYFMRNREPFSLFVPLNIWNLFLAIFSTFGAFNLSFEFFGTIYKYGLQSSYCNVHQYTLGNNGYWVWLFIVSKMFELVDTIFLVLRKRPLLFLHWYHHILTMLYAFYSYPITPAFNRWGIYLNYLVHSYMYSYYFLRSMKIKVPGPVAKFVTTIQIWQFIISVVILIHLGWLTYIQNVKCDLDSKVYAFAVSMDVSYLILFINFFLHAYVLKGGKAKYRTEMKKENGTIDNNIKKDQNENSPLFVSNGELRKRGSITTNGTTN